MTETLRDRQLGDFAHVDTADADDLVGRLDAMHALDSFRAYKRETFELLRPRPGAHFADVGCGTGEDARTLAELAAPGARATGFDVSEAMLAQARERHAHVPGLSFVHCPSDSLPVADDSFDGIRCDRVLIHVPDAAKSLAEMVRVTKPGGRVVVSEPDMPGCWVASNDYVLTDRVMREIAHSCATPYLPRSLYTMFKDAGLQDVTLAVRSAVAFNPQSVAKILDFQGVVRAMLARGEVQQDDVQRWAEDLEQRGRIGRFAAGVGIMIAAGTKA